MHDIQKVLVVYVLRDCYEGTIEGVYTEAGMQAYKDKHIKEALDKYNLTFESHFLLDVK